MIHSQAVELLATLAIVKIYLLLGSFKNLPKFVTKFSDKA